MKQIPQLAYPTGRPTERNGANMICGKEEATLRWRKRRWSTPDSWRVNFIRPERRAKRRASAVHCRNLTKENTWQR